MSFTTTILPQKKDVVGRNETYCTTISCPQVRVRQVELLPASEFCVLMEVAVALGLRIANCSFLVSRANVVFVRQPLSFKR